MKSFHLKTFGCRVNQYEAQCLRQCLTDSGYIETNLEDASVLVIKACCITHEAESKVFRLARSASESHKHVILAGCISSELEQRLKNHAVEIIRHQDIRERFSAYQESISSFCGHTRAFVKIQDGCNSFCTYCIVPFLRPDLSSRSETEIISEVNKLAESGYQEIVLTGIHLGKYGSHPSQLCSVIRSVSGVSGIKRIRLGSMHPQEITDELIDLMKSGLLCPHLHLSVQSGSDQILRAMGRNYDSSCILKTTEKLKDLVPGIELTCDMITGFPGETEADFQDSVHILEQVQFSYAHLFPFSPRKNTAAAALNISFPDKKTVQQRMIKISELRDQLFILRRNLRRGFSEEVLFEEETAGFSFGFTRSYMRVKVRGTGLKNLIRKVIILGIVDDTLDAELD